MPSYDPDSWNTKEKTWWNNCYNYATDNPHPGHPPLLPGAEPGASAGKSAEQPAGTITVEENGQQVEYELSDYECTGEKGLLAAAKADGLKDESHCENNPECWLVACYVRRLNVARQLFGDYHFLRQDTLPDGTKKWSHKPGGEPVTDQKFDEHTKKYNGGPITDPKTDDVGRGPYEFCGYLCCCPEVQVACLTPENYGAREDTVLVTLGGTSGMANTYLSTISAAEVNAEIEALFETTGSRWSEGVGPSSLLCRLDLIGEEGQIQTMLGVAENSLTLWDQEPRHFVDPQGVGAKRIMEMLGLVKGDFGTFWGTGKA